METQDFINTKLLNSQEAASFLGIEEETLAVWRCTKRYPLPYIKVGRLVKYRPSDLQAFIESRLQNSKGGLQ